MTNVCVWIDHSEARIFEILRADVEKNTVLDARPHRHIHRKADHVRLGKRLMSPAFLEEVASTLDSAKAIMIVGPGMAKTELAGYLAEKYPQTAKRIWAIESLDHPSDVEIATRARKYFHAATRMHERG